MDNIIEEYHRNLLASVGVEANADSDFSASTFLRIVATELENAGEITEDFIPVHWNERGEQLNGFCYETTARRLNLFLLDFSNSNKIETIVPSTLSPIIKRGEVFFAKAIKNLLTIEPSLPAYEAAFTIFNYHKDFESIRFVIITDKIRSESIKTLPSKKIDNYDVEYTLWDIARLARMCNQANQKEDIIINFEELTGSALPYLSANVTDNEYCSYLFALPGKALSDIYGKYGPRLLEQNVRAFLQTKGAVNKGIRATILTCPDRFFAYNNGITAVAEEIIFDKSEQLVAKIKNLQIVNGGQTTAQLFSCVKKDKADLTGLYVQMKLTIVSQDKTDVFVPKISEYANTQNKVSKADFFSNHPFHIQMENHSRSIWTPISAGNLVQSKWFYERARGQYLGIQAYKTPTELRRILLENPKTQVITKTDFAKYYNSWAMFPNVVSKGAQYSFEEFAKFINAKWEENQNVFNDLFYKELAAKAIIFKKTESIISDSTWFDGGYRAQTATYSVALLSQLIHKNQLEMDFSRIWANQKVSSIFEKQMKVLTELVYTELINPPQGNSNVGQWAKKEDCWRKIQNIDVDLVPEFASELTTMHQAQTNKKAAIELSKLSNEVSYEMFIYDTPSYLWDKVINYAVLHDLNDHDISLLGRTKDKTKGLTTSLQTKAIMKIVNKLKAKGMEIEGI